MRDLWSFARREGEESDLDDPSVSYLVGGLRVYKKPIVRLLNSNLARKWAM